ncbi:MAG: hypothetical protein AAFQ75_04885, partial [Pseudomonadota bacterium]
MRQADQPERSVQIVSVVTRAWAQLFVIVAIAFAAPALVAPPAAEAQVTSPERGIVVRGNRRIEVDTILAYMRLEPGETVTVEELNLSVRRLFDTG